MSNDLTINSESSNHQEFALIEQVVMQGDLSKLSPQQRVLYYRKVCESAGLNPFTRPFDYITLNGKLTLYAKKDCTEQLRKLHGISIEELDCKVIDDLYVVKAKAKDRNGRFDESTGAVVIGHLKGEAKANAIMKCETKAKRRVTLSICGMGWTDESEIESIPGAKLQEVDLTTGTIEIEEPKQKPLIKTISQDQIDDLNQTLDECGDEYKAWFKNNIKERFNVDDISQLSTEAFVKIKVRTVKHMNEIHDRQRAEFNANEEVA